MSLSTNGQINPATINTGSNGRHYFKDWIVVAVITIEKEKVMTVVITAAIAFVAILLAEHWHLL